MAALQCEDILGLPVKELCSIMQAVGPEEAFGNYYKAQLQSLCERFEIQPSGCKQDIIARLAEHLQNLSFSTSVAICASPLRASLRRHSSTPRSADSRAHQVQELEAARSVAELLAEQLVNEVSGADQEVARKADEERREQEQAQESRREEEAARLAEEVAAKQAADMVAEEARQAAVLRAEAAKGAEEARKSEELAGRHEKEEADRKAAQQQPTRESLRARVARGKWRKSDASAQDSTQKTACFPKDEANQALEEQERKEAACGAFAEAIDKKDSGFLQAASDVGKEDIVGKKTSFADSLTRIASEKQKRDRERYLAAKTWAVFESKLIDNVCAMLMEHCAREAEKSLGTASVCFDALSREIPEFPKRVVSGSMSLVDDWGDEVTAEAWFYATQGITTDYTPGNPISNAEMLESMMPKFLEKVGSLGFYCCRVPGTWKVTASWDVPGETKKQKRDRERQRAAMIWVALESKLIDKACVLFKERCVRQSEQLQGTATVCFDELSREITEFPKRAVSGSVSVVDDWGDEMIAEAWFYATHGITHAYRPSSSISNAEMLESMMPKFVEKVETLGFSYCGRLAGTWKVTASWPMPAKADESPEEEEEAKRQRKEEEEEERRREEQKRHRQEAKRRRKEQEEEEWRHQLEEKEEEERQREENKRQRQEAKRRRKEQTEKKERKCELEEEEENHQRQEESPASKVDLAKGATISPGSMATLEGLSTAAFNGQRAEILEWLEDKDRWHCQLIATDEFGNFRPRNIVPDACGFSPGASVTLQGLSKTGLDGKHAELIQWEPDSGWLCRLTESQEICTVRPRNIVLDAVPASKVDTDGQENRSEEAASQSPVQSLLRDAPIQDVFSDPCSPEVRDSCMNTPEKTPFLNGIGPLWHAPLIDESPSSTGGKADFVTCLTDFLVSQQATAESPARSSAPPADVPDEVQHDVRVQQGAVEEANPEPSSETGACTSRSTEPKAQRVRARSEPAFATPRSAERRTQSFGSSSARAICTPRSAELQGQTTRPLNRQDSSTPRSTEPPKRAKTNALQAKEPWDSASPPRRSAECNAQSIRPTVSPTRRSTEPKAESSRSDSALATEEDLENFGVNQLRSICNSAGLSALGRKTELVSRLLASGVKAFELARFLGQGGSKERERSMPPKRKRRMDSPSQKPAEQVSAPDVSEPREPRGPLTAAEHHVTDELQARPEAPSEGSHSISKEPSAADSAFHDDTQKVKPEVMNDLRSLPLSELLARMQKGLPSDGSKEHESSTKGLLHSSSPEPPSEDIVDDPVSGGHVFEVDDPVSGGHVFEVEVRLAFSGLLVAKPKLISGDTVTDLKRIVAASRAWPPGMLQLCLGSRILESSESVSAAGLSQGSIVTVTCIDLQWHEKVKGLHADVSADGLTVRRRDGLFKFNHSVVITNGPARTFSFEVLDSSARFRGGLELGFSQVPPDELEDEFPHSLVNLRHAWVCDCHGEFHAYGGSFHCLDTDFAEQGWDPERLRKGDVVTCRITENGSVEISLNDRAVADWDARIPSDVPLYPVVGVYGKTTAIKLLK